MNVVEKMIILDEADLEGPELTSVELHCIVEEVRRMQDFATFVSILLTRREYRPDRAVAAALSMAKPTARLAAELDKHARRRAREEVALASPRKRKPTVEE